MPGLVPGIHVLLCKKKEKTWMAGTSPAMTEAMTSMSQKFRDMGSQVYVDAEAVKESNKAL